MSISERTIELEKLLRKLEGFFGFPGELELVWWPHIKNIEVADNMKKTGMHSAADGQTRGKITIYGPDYEKAKETLIHEFIECHLLAGFVEPYVHLVNKLFEAHELNAYKSREQLVRILTRFILREFKENGG